MPQNSYTECSMFLESLPGHSICQPQAYGLTPDYIKKNDGNKGNERENSK